MDIEQLVILDVIGLSPDIITKNSEMPEIKALIDKSGMLTLTPSFPSVTCTVQASLTTGVTPSSHGMICNGLYNRQTREVNFWGRYNSLLDSPRLWNSRSVKSAGLTSSVMFFQNSMYCNSDYCVTPAPLHSHDGGMIQWCYSRPSSLYPELIASLKRPFNLMSFWGPMTSFESSRWIFDAGMHVLKTYSPNLNYIYIPHLDYSSQKFGPHSDQVKSDLQQIDRLIGELRDYCAGKKIGIVILSEYGLVPVDKALALNIVLRKNGWLKTITIQEKEYIDFENSDAFAMVDHQIAHIYINKAELIAEIKRELELCQEIELVLDASTKPLFGIDHSNSGELIAIAKKNCWFSYYWWIDDTFAPTFTRTVDIHRKPGYDPLELFFDPSLKGIPCNTSLIKGSHGRPAVTPDEQAVFISDIPGWDYNRLFGNTDKITDTEAGKAIPKVFGVTID